MMSHTAMTTTARYFDSHRGRALGITTLGHPAGEAVLPLLIVFTAAAAHWRASWVVLGIGLAVVLPLLVPWLLRGEKLRREAWRARIRDASRTARGAADGRRQWRLGEVLRDATFYCMIPAMVAPAFILTGLIFHHLHLLEVKGWSREWFAACFVGFALAKWPAALISGLLIDRIGAVRLLALYLAPLGIGLAALAASDHPAVTIMFLALAGFSGGAGGTIVSAAWAELYGTEHLGAIRAFGSAMMVFATALAPGVMGVMITMDTSIDRIAVLCIVYVVASALLAAAGARHFAARVRRENA